MPSAVAIIPARGGSKRLPRKNVLDFHGKPILAYTIEAALKSSLFERVVVSSEDEEIIEVAKSFGAEIARRDVGLASDSATVVQVCEDWLVKEATAGCSYEVLCCLYATAPLRRTDDIAATVGLLEKGRCNYAIAATRFSHYPHQALKLLPGGSLVPMWPEAAELRSNEIGELLAGNGSTYAVFTEEFLRTRSFYGPDMYAHIMPFSRSVDIDTAEDFDLAWCLAECEKSRNASGNTR